MPGKLLNVRSCSFLLSHSTCVQTHRFSVEAWAYMEFLKKTDALRVGKREKEERREKKQGERKEKLKGYKML